MIRKSAHGFALVFTVILILFIAAAFAVPIPIHTKSTCDPCPPGYTQPTRGKWTLQKPLFFTILTRIFPPQYKTVEVKTPPSPVDETVYTDKGSANWKMYKNQTYNFQLQYPKDWLLEEDDKTENYYDAVAKIISAEGVVSIRTIHGIDIYQNISVLDVTKREIMDSGFKSTTEETKIGNLTTAITKVEDSKKTIRATIAHPNKNLFVEISYTGNKKIFDQILSTFRFLD